MEAYQESSPQENILVMLVLQGQVFNCIVEFGALA